MIIFFVDLAIFLASVGEIDGIAGVFLIGEILNQLFVFHCVFSCVYLNYGLVPESPFP